MIMRPGQPLLLPASPLFIWTSLVVALMLNMLMNMGLWGRAAWVLSRSPSAWRCCAAGMGETLPLNWLNRQ